MTAPALALVKRPHEVATSLGAFVEGLAPHSHRARKLLSQTTYWVYDARTTRFGPGKFVGFRGMTFELYDAAEHDRTEGAKHDGGASRHALEGALGGPFVENIALREQLLAWVDERFGPGAFGGADPAKWKFVTFQSRPDFALGATYTRNDVQDLLDVPVSRRGGKWSKGLVGHDGEWFVFAGVGTPGRTGHDYGNCWTGDQLEWKGQTGSHVDQPTIQAVTAASAVVHVFTRGDGRDPFRYEGRAIAASTRPTVPVTVLWRFLASDQRLPDEVPPGAELREGATQQITVNAYERNPEARRRCVERYGFDCAACGLNFERAYGELGRDYIHVHHIRPISESGGEYVVDPVNDLRPVCPNCHAMLHRGRTPPSIEALRDIVRERGRSVGN